MPLQNRVTPTGDIVASDARGTLMGNRGILHDPGTKTLLAARWTHQAWVCCRLEFGVRRRTIMGPGTYTELFFLDEATALAAGHRPCWSCRPAEYEAFKSAWLAGNFVGRGGFVPIKTLDRQLHRERVTRGRRQMRFDAPLEALPFGAMILFRSRPCLVCDDHLLPWSEHGYGLPVKRHRGRVTVLTPRSIVAALHEGYRPLVRRVSG